MNSVKTCNGILRLGQIESPGSAGAAHFHDGRLPILHSFDQTQLDAFTRQIKLFQVNAPRDSDEHKRILIELYGFALSLTTRLDQSRSRANPVANDFAMDAHSKSRELWSELIEVLTKVCLEDHRFAASKVQNLPKNVSDLRETLRGVRERCAHGGARNLSNVRRELYEFMEELFRLAAEVALPPDRAIEYVIVGIGSWATGLATPYSDLEYFILVKDLEHVPLLTNFAELVELLLLAMGESIPRWRTQELQVFSRFSQLFQAGVAGFRLDSHKHPREFNRLIPLITTPKALIENLCDHDKWIHKRGHHLTAALWTTRYIYGTDDSLFRTYQFALEQALTCMPGCKEVLSSVLRQDLHRSTSFRVEHRNGSSGPGKWSPTLDAYITIKHYLMPLVHLPRVLCLYAIACGRRLCLPHDILEMLQDLKATGC
jgi:hypothetical protein